MPSPALRTARALCASAALLFTVTYLACAARRVSYPWEIEWMEGGMIVHAARVLRGLPIYAPPSLDFIAYFYTPLYAYVLAALSPASGGLSFALGRGVSIAASLATMVMLFYAARRERGALAGVLAVGLYAALFRMTGAFYDLARVDSLSLALLLAAGLVAHYQPTLRGSALAALLAVLAIFCKQTSAVVGIFIGLALLLRSWRLGAVYAAVGGALSLAAAAWLERSSVGWFSFYVWRGHQGHAFDVRGATLRYWRDVLLLSPFALLVPTLGVSYRRRARWAALALSVFWSLALLDRVRLLHEHYSPHYAGLWYAFAPGLVLLPALGLIALLTAARWCSRAQAVSAPDDFFLWLCLGGALASALSYSTQWAHSNCFMPLAVFASLYSGMLFAELLALQAASAPALFAACALLVQLSALVYDPRAQVPSAADHAAARAVLARLDKLPAPVLMPAHPLYSYLRDGTFSAHAMGFRDVAHAGGVPGVEERLASGAYRTVVVDTGGRYPNALVRHFRRVDTFAFQGRTLLPLTGYNSRPHAVFVYRAATPATALSH